MFATTFLTISLLVAPQEVSIVKSEQTPKEVAQFGGVVVDIQRSVLSDVLENDVVVINDFPLGTDEEVKLRLQRFEVLSPDAEIVKGSVNIDGDVLHRKLPRPNLVLLKGAIEGDASSRVFIAIGEHTTNGLIERNGETFVLAKDKTRGWTIVYNLSDVDPDDMNWVDFQCGVEDAASPILEQKHNRTDRSLGECQALQIAVDTDSEFTLNLFEGNTSASSEYATTLMAAMSTIYSSDVNVGIQISFLRLWDSASDPWSAASTGSQLPQFREHWQTEMGGIPRHLAHLLSGRSLGGGIAYVGAVCTNLGYAVSANLNGSFPLPLEDHNQNNWDIVVVAHETGHNCGTWHTHDYSPVIDGCGNDDCSQAFGGTIMSYCHICSGGMSNIVLSFHERVQITIENFLANDIPCSLECDQSLTGVCCNGDTCSESTTLECELSFGTFLGTGTTCETASCSAQVGACCTGVVGDCADINSMTCTNIGGTFVGLGSACSQGWCNADAENACCIDDSCSQLTATDCQLAGGSWAGVGTTCATGGCEPLVNDFCDTATIVTTGVTNFSNIGALDGEEPYDSEDCEDEYLGNVASDVWFKYDACQSGQLLVSTCEIINFDSDIVVYEGSCNDMVQVECNGDGDDCGGFTSEVALEVYSGESYLIRVGGFSANNTGHGQLLIGGINCEPDVPCVGDVDANLMVDILDLLIIINHWNETSVLYDVDDNGVVGNGDLLFIIANWGNCD